MVTICEATAEDFPLIRKMAYEIWPVAYGNILSQAQLDYMLANFYSEAVLLENFTNKGHRFLLAADATGNLGFASYEHGYEQMPITRLHKLYVLPSAQGKGVGKLLLSEVERFAREHKALAISLNVNKFNKAYDFYLKCGFVKKAEIDIPIGNGYLMEDYKMEKQL